MIAFAKFDNNNLAQASKRLVVDDYDPLHTKYQYDVNTRYEVISSYVSVHWWQC